MRWAVLGPIIGFILLYFILRFAVDNFRADTLVLQDEHGVSTLQEVAIASSTEMTATVEGETEAGVEGEAATEGAPDASEAVTTTETITGTTAMTGTGEITATGGITAGAGITGTEAISGTETAVADAEAEEPGTVWVMQTLNGEDALGGWPIIAVVGSDGSITGSAGCNYYNASFTTEGDAVSVAVPTSTRMVCASELAMAQENAYLAALTKVTNFDQQDPRLTLSGDDVEITYVSLDILYNLSWLAGEYRNEAGEMVEPLADSAITANFSLTEEAISGLDGCNNYEAAFTVQGDLVIMDAPVVTPAGAGTLECEPGGELDAQAQAYLASLQEARLFSLSEDTLTFFDEGHEAVVSFVSAKE